MKFENAAFEKCAGNVNQFPMSDLPEIVFSGKSNVGKSSLINKFFNKKKLAKIGKNPGKTKTINFFLAEIQNNFSEKQKIRFVDLPGYGYAKVSKEEKKKWSKLVENYFSSNRKIVQVIQILDIRHNPTKLDFEMLDFLKSSIPFVIILSKSDKLNKTERLIREKAFEEQLKKYKNIIKIPFSTVTGEGLTEIQNVAFASSASI